MLSKSAGEKVARKRGRKWSGSWLACGHQRRTKEREGVAESSLDCGTRREVACDLTLRRNDKGERRGVLLFPDEGGRKEGGGLGGRGWCNYDFLHPPRCRVRPPPSYHCRTHPTQSNALGA